MRAAFLWSGGKDCCLSYQRAVKEGYEPAVLVTLMGERPFLCHPLEVSALQSRALGVPQIKVKISEPYLAGYRRAITEVAIKYNVDAIISGDISVADAFHGNFMDQVFEGLKVKFYRPLWGLDRFEILQEYISNGIRPVFTCVKRNWFEERWLGRSLDADCASELRSLSERYGIDACGEGGEYHTMVLDMPLFKGSIKMEGLERGRAGDLLYIRPRRISLEPKTARSL
jgi:diphthine-ammonia ligase